MARRIEAATAWMLLVVMTVQVLAVLMMPSLFASDIRVFENPDAKANVLFYLLLVLGFTAFLLIAIRFGRRRLVSAVIQISVAMSIFYVVSAFIPAIPSFAVAIGLTLLLWLYPEWYVVDSVGIIISAGVAALFGLSMTVLPALILLLSLAVYDAISVYKTKHMIALAEGAIDVRAPILFVIPRKRGYSFRRNGTGNGSLLGGTGEKKAYFLGLGDAIIPTVLVISANWSMTVARFEILGAILNAPAIGAMLGTYLGFAALMLTPADRPHAGLPFLNGGAIAGFLLGCAISGLF